MSETKLYWHCGGAEAPCEVHVTEPDDDVGQWFVRYEAFAAARREVETVTRERDLARIDALNERTRRKAVEAERDADVVSLTDENETLTDDLATSRAALEDVLWQEAHPNVEVVSRRRAEDDEKLWVAYDRSGNVNDTEWFAIAEGDTWKEALRNARRALAQEAGDDTP